MILFHKKFGMCAVPLEVTKDNNLSLSARGMYAYLCTKPEDWVFNIGEIQSHSKESRAELETFIKELVDANLLSPYES